MKCLTVFRCMTISMSCCCRKGTFGTRVPVTVRRVSDSQQLTRRHNSHLGFPARSGDGRRRRRPAFSAHVHLRCQVIGTLVIAWHRSTCDHIGRIALPSAGVYVAWSPLCDLYRCCDQYCSVVAWPDGDVVSHINEISVRQAQLWVTIRVILSRYVTSHSICYVHRNRKTTTDCQTLLCHWEGKRRFWHRTGHVSRTLCMWPARRQWLLQS